MSATVREQSHSVHRVQRPKREPYVVPYQESFRTTPLRFCHDVATYYDYRNEQLSSCPHHSRDRMATPLYRSKSSRDDND